MYDMYRESTSVGLYETFQIANVVYGIFYCKVYGVWYGMVLYHTIRMVQYRTHHSMANPGRPHHRDHKPTPAHPAPHLHGQGLRLQ